MIYLMYIYYKDFGDKMLDKEQIMREALDMSGFVGGSYQDVISFVLDNGKRE